jgi:hypothetical protein
MAMGWRSRCGIWLGTLACAVAASTTAAPAAVPEKEQGALGVLRLQGSNGYAIVVFAFGVPRDRGKDQVLIAVVRGKTGALYFVPATVTGDPSSPLGSAATAASIQADLGGLGRIDLTFHPSGEREVDRSCDGGVSYASGTYEGIFEFHGEEGYTGASTGRTPFNLEPLQKLECSGTRGSGEVEGPGLPGAKLLLTSSGSGRKLRLQVNENRPGRPVRLEARVWERRGRIRITRGVLARTASSAFSFDPMLKTASLEPQAPFSGAGVFRRNAPPVNRWSGNLTVDFPGNSDVPLTGRDIRASLAHARHEEKSFPRGETQRLGAFVTPWVTKAPHAMPR